MNRSKCLHCGEGEPSYCEKCYQDLIGENAKLQFKNNQNKKCLCQNKKYTIRISVDEWNDEQKKWDYFNDFDIDYCPICGRKIGDE